MAGWRSAEWAAPDATSANAAAPQKRTPDPISPLNKRRSSTQLEACVVLSLLRRVWCAGSGPARAMHIGGFFGRDVIFPTRPVVIETSRASLVKHNACCTRHRRSTVLANALAKGGDCFNLLAPAR